MRQSWVGWVLILVLTGCFGGQRNSTLNEIENKLNLALRSPFVEAYFEYTGTQKKWGGAPTLIIHIQARDAAQETRVWVTPPIHRESEGTPIQNRVLASDSQGETMSVSRTRDQLAELANQIQQSGPVASSDDCLYPVKAWLIKSDGGMIEAKGCRGQTGWVQEVSRMTEKYIQLSIYQNS